MTEVIKDGENVRCNECQTSIAAGQDYEMTEDGAFCRPCYDALRRQVIEVVDSQSQEINYPTAFVAGVAGAVLGGLVWWGFTMMTQIAFGFVAIVIGWAVGRGVIIGSGGKRGRGLQVLSVLVSAVAYFYASYLVTRSLVLRAMAERGESISLPLLPDLHQFYTVLSLSFGMMDLIFLGIVLFEAWRQPAPIRLGG